MRPSIPTLSSRVHRSIAVQVLAAALSSVLAAQSPATTPVFLNINPSWSPDGRQLVFQSERTGRTALYVINADGTGVRRLTWSDADNTHPAWSPDGTTIAFLQKAGKNKYELYVVTVTQ